MVRADTVSVTGLPDEVRSPSSRAHGGRPFIGLEAGTVPMREVTWAEKGGFCLRKPVRLRKPTLSALKGKSHRPESLFPREKPEACVHTGALTRVSLSLVGMTP